MNSPIATLLSLSFSLLLAGACAPAPEQPGPTSNLSLLSNGPNLPEECNVCWDDFQGCFSQGIGAEECANSIVECIDACNAPPPPPECLHCAAGFDACVTSAEANGDSGEDCAAGFEGCLASCEGDAQCGQDPAACEPTDPQPEPDTCSECDELFGECINDSWQDGFDPLGDAGCEQELEACFDNCQVGPNPGIDDPCDAVNQCASADDRVEIDGQELDCDFLFEVCQPLSDECHQCQEMLGECAANDSCEGVNDFCQSVCQ